MNLVNILEQGAGELCITLSPVQIEKFFSYFDLIKKWNKKINLTSITDDNEIVVKHFLDSLTVSDLIKDGSNVLDIGTGAGFPGIPLAIVRESLKFTVLDSKEKKIFFINEVIRELEIQNVKTAASRAEDSNNTISRSHFDYVITRAVGDIDVVLNMSAPYIKASGKIVLMRGKEGKFEWKSYENRNFELLELKELKLPGTDFMRVLLLLKQK